MFAHETTNLFVVHDKTCCRADAALTVELELVADREHRFDNGGVVGRPFLKVIIGGARDFHQRSFFRDGDAQGR